MKSTIGDIPELAPPASALTVYQFENRGDTQVVGGEVSLAGRPNANWSWDMNYTYQSVEDDLTVNQTVVTHLIDFEGATPSHLANAHLGWPQDRLSLDGYLNYVSSTYMPLQPALFGGVTEPESDGYVALSVRGGYQLNDHLAVAVNAQNANFGDGELTNSGLATESRFWGSLRASY